MLSNSTTYLQRVSCLLPLVLWLQYFRDVNISSFTKGFFEKSKITTDLKSVLKTGFNICILAFV